MQWQCLRGCTRGSLHIGALCMCRRALCVRARGVCICMRCVCVCVWHVCAGRGGAGVTSVAQDTNGNSL